MSRFNKPNSLSLSSQRGSSPLTVFVASSGPALMSPYSYAREPKAGCNTASGMSPEWSRGTESFPHLLPMLPGIGLGRGGF